MSKPDFTGTWWFNRARSRLEIPAPDAGVLSIRHREPIRTRQGHNVVRYRLAAPGTLVADESFRSNERAYDNVWWFDRKADTTAI